MRAKADLDDMPLRAFRCRVGRPTGRPWPDDERALLDEAAQVDRADRRNLLGREIGARPDAPVAESERAPHLPPSNLPFGDAGGDNIADVGHLARPFIALFALRLYRQQVPVLTKPCANCGTEFEKLPTVSLKTWATQKKFCSMACKAEFQRKNPSPKRGKARVTSAEIRCLLRAAGRPYVSPRRWSWMI